jgi:hypothetical protein
LDALTEHRCLKVFRPWPLVRQQNVYVKEEMYTEALNLVCIVSSDFEVGKVGGINVI